MKLSKQARTVLSNWKDDLDKCDADGRKMNLYAYRARMVYGNFAGDSDEHDLNEVIELRNYVEGINHEYTLTLKNPFNNDSTDDLCQQYINESDVVLASIEQVIA